MAEEVVEEGAGVEIKVDKTHPNTQLRTQDGIHQDMLIHLLSAHANAIGNLESPVSCVSSQPHVHGSNTLHKKLKIEGPTSPLVKVKIIKFTVYFMTTVLTRKYSYLTTNSDLMIPLTMDGVLIRKFQASPK